MENAHMAIPRKIVIYNSTFEKDPHIYMLIPLDAAKELVSALEDPGTTNPLIAQQLRDAIEITDMGHSYVGFVERQGEE